VTAHFGLAEQTNRRIRFRQRALDILESHVVRGAIDEQRAGGGRTALANDRDRQAKNRACVQCELRKILRDQRHESRVVRAR
jgi:hypothetical protein